MVLRPSNPKEGAVGGQQQKKWQYAYRLLGTSSLKEGTM
jgi:hypothetical protein